MKITEAMKNNKANLRPAKLVDADILGPRLIFIIITLALVLFGLVMIFSASNAEALNNNESPLSYLFKQLIFCVVGIGGGIIIWRFIPFRWWRNNYVIWSFFGLLSIFMFITLMTGPDILGARRWIFIGGASFQPSEFAKIILVLIVAKYYAEYRIGHIPWYICVLIGGGISLAMLIFILKGQSDLGTTVICLVGILAVLYVAGMPNWLFWTIVFVCIFAAIGVAITSWRAERMIFLDPWNDGADGYGDGYQLIRSYYAFAEGGLAGVGLGNSYEKYQYLPEAETDFIFAIIGNELGFIGCILVIALFVAFLIFGLIIATRSESRFASSISAAFVIMIVFQAFLNILCVVGLSPTTGKPLPFISSGGSSLIATLFMVGFVLAASEAEAMPDEYERRRSNFKVSGNVEPESEPVMTSEEILNAKLERGFKKIGARASKSVKSAASTAQTKSAKPNPYKNRNKKANFKTPKLPNIKIPRISSPKFIDANKKNRENLNKRPSTKSSLRYSKTNSKKIQSTSDNQSNNSRSYAYRRTNAKPSFKPRGAAISSNKDLKNSTSDSRNVNKRQSRDPKKKR